MNRAYIIQTTQSTGDQIRSQRTEIWDSQYPLGIGFPFRWILEKTQEGIRVRDLRTLTVGEYSESHLAKQSLALNPEWMIQITPSKAEMIHQNWESLYVSHSHSQTHLERLQPTSFRNTTLASMGALFLGFLLFTSISSLFQSQDEGVIPPQFAKIILTPPGQSGASQSNQKTSQSEARSKAVNIVRAFQSTEVQKSTQKLLSQNVLNLLTRSDLTSNQKTKTTLQSLFHSKSNIHAQPTTSLDGLAKSAQQPLTVAALGGGTQGTGQGTGSVGYGKGEKAGIQGQGNSFINLNTRDAVVEEGLTKEEVGKVIHAHLGEVRYCYESAMIKNPTLQGKLIIDFVIQGTGRVKTAQVNNSNLGDFTLDQCILSHLLKWNFPHPKGGVEVAVTYPFIFKPLEK